MRWLLLLSVLSGIASAQGTCPAGNPLSGLVKCYFVAANGLDTNNGTSESTPWLHAPGMPNCASTCLALSAGNGGIGIILRGGDTWHEGNSTLSPYTGGAWDLYGWFSNAYATNIPGCNINAQSGCLYVGVDKAWFSGANWVRPIITGDNPTTGLGTTLFAASCAFTIANPANNFGPNNLVNMPASLVFDNFELTGLCASNTNTNNNGQMYLSGWAAVASNAMSFLENTYMHGWSATSAAGSVSVSHPVTIIAGGGGVKQVLDHNVIDGSDSNPTVVAWGAFPDLFTVRYNMIRYAGQGVGGDCHDIHDNIFEHFYMTEFDGHFNMLECNDDHSASGTANVIYNNISRHFDPGFGSGEVWWTCPNTTPEYWFNNMIYDVPGGKAWAYAGAAIYPSCVNTGGQFMFNNTIVDAPQVCDPKGSTISGGIYLTVLNEHLINAPFDTTTADPNKCIGISDASNISMSDATATAQGYTTGAAGTVATNNCANDTTKPCSPISSGNSTISAGGNHQAYCAQLATYTGDANIAIGAATACQNSTTNACTYDSTNHVMNCPAQAVLARPSGAAWDSGVYQFTGAPPGLNHAHAPGMFAYDLSGQTIPEN